MATLNEAIVKNTYANIPSAGTDGRLFWASDTKMLYRDNGATWDAVLDISSLSADASPDASNDYLMTLDATDSTLKKVLITNLPGASASVTTLLDSISTAAGSASFNVGSITTGYKKIEIICTCRSSTNTSANLLIQFNGDTTATNYQSAFDINGTGAAAGNTNDNRIGYLMPSDQTAGRFAANMITLYDYDGATHKNATCESNYTPTTGYAAAFSTTWLSTAAINQITIVPGAGNFVQYSRCTILAYS